MTRPTDWWVLDFAGDPTPGDPFAIRDLARRYGEFVADVEAAAGRLRALTARDAVAGWVGRSGAAFRDEVHDLPTQLRLLSRSDEAVDFGRRFEAALARLGPYFRCDAVCTVDNPCARRDFVQFFDENGSQGLKLLNHVSVVDDLFANVDGRPIHVQGDLHHVDSAYHAGAKASWPQQDNLLPQGGHRA